MFASVADVDKIGQLLYNYYSINTVLIIIGGNMKYRRITAALLAVLIGTVITGCSGSSHIIIQHTSRSDHDGNSKPYSTDDSLTKDDITLTVWESKDGPDEWIKKAGESFNALYPNIHIEYVNV